MHRSTQIWTGVLLAASLALLPLLLGQGCPAPGGATGAAGTQGPAGPVGPPGPRTIVSVVATGAVVGGQGFVRVTLDDLASEDTAITLTSSNPAVATVPDTATVLTASDNVDVPFNGVAPGQADITAQLGDSSRTTTATVVPEIRIVALFGGSAIQTGATASLTLVLNITVPTDEVINLSSSNISVLNVPASITVPSFSDRQTLAVTGGAAGTATITATLGSSSVALTINVVPTVTLDRLSLPSPILVGGPFVLSVSTDAVVAVDTAVALTSSNPAVIAVPANITVPANTNFGQLPLTALAAGETTVTASLNGIKRTSTVQVVSVPSIRSTSVFPSTVPKGGTASVQVSLDVNVISDTLIALTSSNPAVIQVPASLTILAGQSSGTTSAAVLGTGPAVITATLGNSSQAANVLGIEPSTTAPVLEGAFGPTTLNVGTASTIAVVLTGPATADTAVTLANDNAAALSVPATATIPVGTDRVEVPVQGLAVGTAKVTVTVGGSSFALKIQVVTPTLAISNLFASNVNVGFSTVLNINLTEQVTADTAIALSSSPTGVLTIPSSAVVLSGDSNVGVPITGATASNVTITATLGGSTKTITITVLP